jgi:O-antigen/teichoic acid export membrane protein
MSVAWLLGEKALRVGSALLVATAVARHLGPAQYGALAVAVAWLALPSSAAGMGADYVNQSLLAKNTDANFLHSAFVLRLSWAVVCALAAVACAWWLQADPLGAYIALSLGVGLVSCAIFLHALYAQGRFRLASVLGLLSLTVGVALRLLGIHLDWGPVEFAWCVMLEMALPGVLAAAVAFTPMPKQELRESGRWCGATARHYIKLCWPTTVSAVLVTLFLRLDLFIVDRQLGKQAAGAWAAAMMFVVPWSMVCAALLPVASRALHQHAHALDAFRAQMVLLLRRMLLLSLGAIAVNWAVLTWFVPVLLGPSFEAAIKVGLIASLTIPMAFMGATQELWLAHRQQTGLVLRKVLAGLPVSASLSWLAVSHYGLWGAAVGMVIAQCLTAVALNAWLDRDFFHLQLKALGLRHEH